jgi:hypothetical protein
MNKPKLYEQWGARDDRRLSNKTISSRLPVHVLARIMAICDLYPSRTRSEIINDLLKAGLEVFESELPKSSYHADPEEIEADANLLPSGTKTQYRQNANAHYQALESELGNDKAAGLFSHAELRGC